MKLPGLIPNNILIQLAALMQPEWRTRPAGCILSAWQVTSIRLRNTALSARDI